MFHDPGVIGHHNRPARILLVEDNPGDVRLVVEAIKEIGSQAELTVVMNGVEAMDFLYKRDPYAKASTPDIILLDLNLPKKDGRMVLKEIKMDSKLRRIPVIVLTISQAQDDIDQCYDLYANCYMVKPLKIHDFIQLIHAIEYFWLNIAVLPQQKE